MIGLLSQSFLLVCSLSRNSATRVYKKYIIMRRETIEMNANVGGF